MQAVAECFSCGALTPCYLVSGCALEHLSHFVVCGDCVFRNGYPRCLTPGCAESPCDWIWLGATGVVVTSWD